MMYKTPTFAEPQQYNRPLSWGHVSAFINEYGNWHVATPHFTNERFTYLVVLLVSGYIFFTRNKCLCLEH